jgi:dihydrofolate reductase
VTTTRHTRQVLFIQGGGEGTHDERDDKLVDSLPANLEGGQHMTKIVAAITMSVDGYITGPNDGPGNGLGDGGERLHYWVFGGPWTYENEPRGHPDGEDAEYLDEVTARVGAIVIGRGMYEAAGRWGDRNPFGVPVFVVTHRPEEEPDSGEFTFVGGFHDAIDRARAAAGGKDVAIGGGGDVIRQGLDAGLVDELAIIVAPVILGAGKRLFEDFTKSLDLENLRVRQSRWATFLEFAVKG